MTLIAHWGCEFLYPFLRSNVIFVHPANEERAIVLLCNSCFTFRFFKFKQGRRKAQVLEMLQAINITEFIVYKLDKLIV